MQRGDFIFFRLALINYVLCAGQILAIIYYHFCQKIKTIWLVHEKIMKFTCSIKTKCEEIMSTLNLYAVFTQMEIISLNAYISINVFFIDPNLW